MVTFLRFFINLCLVNEGDGTMVCATSPTQGPVPEGWGHAPSHRVGPGSWESLHLHNIK